LIDGLGAVVSALFLGVVLVEFDEVFGIPKPTLYFLALFPCLFAVYDFYCYNAESTNFGTALMGIAVMNTAYSFLSAGLTTYHFRKITYFGWGYLAL